MRSLNLEEVKGLAKLSALKLTDSEIVEYVGELNDILVLISKVPEADASGKLEYLNTVDVSQLREDVPSDSLLQQVVLMNAPKQRKGQFSVPKVVD